MLSFQVSLTKAKELLRNYTKAVIDTIRFLQRAALVLLPSICSARSCSERLKDTQQALLTLDTEFQSRISQLQTQNPQHPCFNPQHTEFLHIELLGKLLVRLSTLKAQAQIQLESLKRYIVGNLIVYTLVYKNTEIRVFPHSKLP